MMRQAVIIGAGGHCRVLLSLLAACEETKVLGIVDLVEPRVNEVIMDIPVIGSIDSLDVYHGRSDLDFFLAIGDNTKRQIWWKKLSALGFSLPNLISPHAVIDPTARLGKSNVVCAMAFIGPGVVMGDNNLVNTAAVLEHEVRAGSHCHFACSSTVAGRSQIGDRCFIGAGATVIDQVKMDAGITIGAGATVVHKVLEPGVYVGTPARKLSAS